MISDAEFAELKAENEQLKQQVQFLLEQLKLAKHNQFGASSEKSVDLDGGEQLSIFNEAEALADPSVPEPEIEKIKAYTRRKAGQTSTACRRICPWRKSSMSCRRRSSAAQTAAILCTSWEKKNAKS